MQTKTVRAEKEQDLLEQYKPLRIGAVEAALVISKERSERRRRDAKDREAARLREFHD